MADASLNEARADGEGAIGFSAYGIALLALCVFVAMTEGYDVIAMALAAPIIAVDWSLAPPQIGILLAASVIGLVIGSFALSPLGDRLGRRPSILIALTIAGLGTGAGAFVDQFTPLLITRLVAGLGLGFALPNVLALAMEVAPSRLRTFAVVLVSCGYPMGAGFGGALAGRFTAEHGHGAIFLLGGAATLVSALLCLLLLPESPLFLERDPTRRPQLNALLRRLRVLAPETWSPGESRVEQRSTIAALFAPGRGLNTLLLWLVNFANGCTVYYFMTWLPTLVAAKGVSAEIAISAMSLFSASGVIGALLLAGLLRPVGPTFVLGGCYAISIASITALSWLGEIGPLYWAMIAVSGAMVIGSQFCLTAIVNLFYPTSIRVTGAGYASGAARIGAILAPLAGGYALSVVTSPEHAFAIATAPAALALIGVALLHLAGRRARNEQRVVKAQILGAN